MAGMGLAVEELCFHPYYRSLIECGDGKRKETQDPTAHGLLSSLVHIKWRRERTGQDCTSLRKDLLRVVNPLPTWKQEASSLGFTLDSSVEGRQKRSGEYNAIRGFEPLVLYSLAAQNHRTSIDS